MQTLITYGSQYGSTKEYAERFAKLTGYPILPYGEVRSMAGYDREIHFGALYAGGVMGLRRIASLLPAQTQMVVVTVGLADVQDAENTQHILKDICSGLRENVMSRTSVFHLRGAIDYGKLGFKHRTMMSMLYAKAKGIPEEKRTADTKALIETYGQRVSFFSETALRRLADVLLQQ